MSTTIELKIRDIKMMGNTFCGPAAIASLTDHTTGEAARLLREVSDRSRIRGTTIEAMKGALAKCGITAVKAPSQHKQTVAAWLREHEQLRADHKRVFLMVAGCHYTLIQSDQYVCGQSKTVHNIGTGRLKMRSRVANVFELTAPKGVTFPAQQMTIGKLRRIAAKHGIRIEDESGMESRYVHIPGLTDDPFEGDHYAGGLYEIEERINVYIKHLTAQSTKEDV